MLNGFSRCAMNYTTPNVMNLRAGFILNVFELFSESQKIMNAYGATEGIFIVMSIVLCNLSQKDAEHALHILSASAGSIYIPPSISLLREMSEFTLQ